jgi:hypothetical protein
MREPLHSLRSDSSFSLPLQLSSWADLDAVAQPHQAGGGSFKDDDDANTFTFCRWRFSTGSRCVLCGCEHVVCVSCVLATSQPLTLSLYVSDGAVHAARGHPHLLRAGEWSAQLAHPYTSHSPWDAAQATAHGSELWQQ